MAIPKFEDFISAALEVFGNGKDINKFTASDEIAQKLHLTQEDKSVYLPSGKELVYVSRSVWAMYYLYRAGLLQKPKKSTYSLTDLGRKILESKPNKINSKYLMQFESFKAYATPRKQDETETRLIKDENIGDIDSTPEEVINDAFNVLKRTLAKDMLEIILKMKPSFFERLVVDLLLAMGYGGTRADAGRAVGQTGDEGIDGIIDEDKLGLDKIYIQAKRWTNTVGRPVLQQFAGSLVGMHAHKGVFITTSDFTKDARDYVSKVGSTISLINGDKLVELMIEHNIGVNEQDRLIIKKIDHDYFSDEDM